MTNRDIFRAVGGISDELIDNAAMEPEAPRAPRRRRFIVSAAAMAACAALVFAVWKTSDAVGELPSQDVSATPAESASSVSPGNGVFVPAPPYEGVYIPPVPMPKAPEPASPRI